MNFKFNFILLLALGSASAIEAMQTKQEEKDIIEKKVRELLESHPTIGSQLPTFRVVTITDIENDLDKPITVRVGYVRAEPSIEFKIEAHSKLEVPLPFLFKGNSRFPTLTISLGKKIIQSYRPSGSTERLGLKITHDKEGKVILQKFLDADEKK